MSCDFWFQFPIWRNSVGNQKPHVTGQGGASNWDWLTVGLGLLSLQQVRVEGGGNVFISSVSSLSLIFLFLLLTSLSSPLLSLLSLFSLSLVDDTKLPTKGDVSLNPNTTNHRKRLYFYLYTCFFEATLLSKFVYIYVIEIYCNFPLQ